MTQNGPVVVKKREKREGGTRPDPRRRPKQVNPEPVDINKRNRRWCPNRKPKPTKK